MIIIFLKEKVNVRTTISKCKNSLTKMAVLKMKVHNYTYTMSIKTAAVLKPSAIDLHVVV